MILSKTDRRAEQVAMLTAGLALAHQVAAKSLREGLFLATFSVADLPRAMLGSALFAVPTALFVARLMARMGPAQLAPRLFFASALGSFLEWCFLPSAPRLVALVVYFHVSIGGALLLSSFWSIVNERFDPHTLKQVVGHIGGSATFGGLVGGLLMERATHWLSVRGSLLLIFALSSAATICVRHLGSTAAPGAPAPGEKAATPGFTRYLWNLALLVACTAAISTFGDFALKQAAVLRFASAAELVRFFAVFYTAASLLGFLIQTLVARKILDAIGVGGTLALPPTLGLALGSLSVLSPSLATIAALRGSDLALGPSLFRSAFEPLFTPVPAAIKRRGKALIDVLFDKGGDIFASSLILAVGSAAPALAGRAPLVLATATSGLCVFLSLRAQRGYVAELEMSLRAGTLNLDATAMDQRTRMTLSATAFGIDRNQLLEQIARLGQAKTEGGKRPDRAPSLSEADEQLVRDVRVLLGSERNALAEVLGRPALDARLAAFVVPLLAQDDLAKAAVAALRAMADGALGVLTQSLLREAEPLVIRRRIPHVLRHSRAPGAAKALTLALHSEPIEVRYRAALALLEMTSSESTLLPDRQQIWSIALTEVRHGPLTRASLDHVFALLGLCIARGPLELSRQGVLSDDRKLRGTALEYLASLLPESLRSPLITALSGYAAPEPGDGATKPDALLADQLQQSLRAELAPPSLSSELD